MQRVASPPPQSVESHFYIVFNMLASDEHRGLRDQTTKLFYLAQNQENEEAIFQCYELIGKLLNLLSNTIF
ncbi:hypothetical protein ACFX2J_005151 [Malus domestica]